MIVPHPFSTLAIFPPLIGITIAVLANAGSTTLSLSSLNTTSLSLPIVPVDRRFTVEGVFSDSPLDELSCLMAGVDTTAILALENWIDVTRAFRTRPLPKYPLVYIEAEIEPPATEIPIRFLIWGLEMALHEYVIRDRFDESQFHLLYNGRKVGAISFRSTLALRPAQSEQNASSSHHVAPINTTSSTASWVPDPTRSESSTEIAFSPHAQAFDRGTVFLGIYATLRAVAFPRTTSISAQPFQIRPGWGRNIAIGFTSSDGPDLPRRQPPELQYRWIIEALREVPDWMVENAFKEVEITVYVKHILVGRGYVDKTVAGAETE